MTRAVLWVVPLVGALAALLGAAIGRAGWTLGLLVGALAAGVLHAVASARVRSVARRVTRWASGSTQVPLELSGGPAWQELGGAVNTLAGELRDLRAERAVLAPWGRRLVRAVDGPALLFDDDLRFVAQNDAATALFGTPQASTRAVTPLRVLGSGVLAQAVDHARLTSEDVRVAAHVGENDVEAVATSLGGQVLVMVTDRSQQRRVEELRRDFVTNASHELKTPVTAIASLVAALALVDGERREELLARLEGESDRLVTLVHDLLDLRRVDGGADVDALAPVDLVTLVREGLQRVASTAEPRDIGVGARLPASAVVVGRRQELQLVVDNLLANAVKYNRDGGDVHVVLRAEEGDVVLSVRDTGIGIPRHELSRVFERFYRIDTARARAAGGTGLGLSIVRHAVDGHGGTVSVDSLLGSGTTFTVRLPVAADAAPRRVPGDAGSRAGRTR